MLVLIVLFAAIIAGIVVHQLVKKSKEEANHEDLLDTILPPVEPVEEVEEPVQPVEETPQPVQPVEEIRKPVEEVESKPKTRKKAAAKKPKTKE